MNKSKSNKKKSQKSKRRGPRPAKIGGFPQPRQLSDQKPNRTRRSKKTGHSAVANVCALTDPFCVHANLAQRPDASGPTIPFKVHGLIQCQAYTTTGSCRYVFTHNPLWQFNNAVIVGTTATMTGNWQNGIPSTFVNTNAKEVRVLSFGCVIRSQLAASDSGGFLVVSADASPTINQVATLGSMSSSEAQVHSLAAGTEITWVSKPLGPNSNMFRPIGDFVTNTSNFDWSSLVIDVQGASTTSSKPYLTVEYFLNIEMTCTTGDVSGIGLLAKPAPRADHATLAAASVAQTSTNSFIKGGIEVASGYLKKAATTALEDVLESGMLMLTM